MDEMVSCLFCGSYAVVAIEKPDEEGMAEHQCEDCGEYFVEKARETEDETPIHRIRP